MADTGVDARAVLEREDGTVIEVVEANPQDGRGDGEGVRGDVEEEVALGVVAKRRWCAAC